MNYVAEKENDCGRSQMLFVKYVNTYICVP